jgi:hypothetical protein
MRLQEIKKCKKNIKYLRLAIFKGKLNIRLGREAYLNHQHTWVLEKISKSGGRDWEWWPVVYIDMQLQTKE